jgi:hypothetical protein
VRNRLLIVFGVAALVAICAGRHGTVDRHQGEASWDQGALKKGDTGCPTSIYDAPRGMLELCP